MMDDDERRAFLRAIRNTPLEALDPAFPHAVNIPSATYAPWASDHAFARVYDAIRGNTLVDVYRCHELWQLCTRQCRVAGDVLEVGTWRGGTGAILAAASSGDPARTVFLCDTFAGVVKAGPRDTLYQGGEHADARRTHVEDLLARLDLRNARILEGVFPDRTADAIASRTFALCHIDVDVYESAKDVFEWAAPRLARHGIVVFDDYGFKGCEGVTRLVNELAADPGYFTVHNLNGHAVMLKLA